jgi:fused signal recognition particle receptor
MFDLLKKKISGFAEKIIGSTKEEIKAPVEEEIATEPAQAIEKLPSLIKKEEAEAEPLQKLSETKEKTHLPEIREREERELKAKVGFGQKIKSVFTGTVTIKEETINDFLEEFELSLLEADVEINTAQALIEELRKRLSNKTISSSENMERVILREIKTALSDIVNVEPIDFDRIVEANKPCIILILGPNGAGKTTTIAKLGYYFTKQKKQVILASADTFRAGSIEQLQVHADKLGLRIIKHQYGADPAAVAYDAVKAAKASNADVVLIDSAGRQDTNKNLLEELKKIQRVIQPHLKLYIGESFTGQAILTQAKTFDETIEISGFVLTKLDTDTKGGGVLSVMHSLQKPVVFFGTGQGYEDLVKFSMDDFLERLIPGKGK